MMRRLSLVLTIVLTVSATVSAEPITWRFTSTVTRPSTVFPTVEVGDVIVGTVTFEADTPICAYPDVTDPNNVIYCPAGVFTATIGEQVFLTAPLYQINVFSRLPPASPERYRYTVTARSGTGPGTLQWQFVLGTEVNGIGSIDLPREPFFLTDFEYQLFATYTSRDGVSFETDIVGTPIDSLELVPEGP